MMALGVLTGRTSQADPAFPLGTTGGVPRRAFVLGFVLLCAAMSSPVVVSAQGDPECARWRRAFATMPTQTLVIRTREGRSIRMAAKTAATDEARWAGFQCATVDEVRRTVVLFDFGREVLGAFHMRNVPAALDIAFVKESGHIFSIVHMDPDPSGTYGPMGSYQYAIEASAGFFRANGVSPGAQLVVRE